MSPLAVTVSETYQGAVHSLPVHTAGLLQPTNCMS